MAGFKAEEVIEELSYDFGKYGGEGVTPEPSSAKIIAFQKAVRAIVAPTVVEQAKAEERGKVTVAQLEEAMANIDKGSEETAKILDDILAAVAKVCSNKPSLTELRALPFRLQQHFIGYISGLFLGETPTPVTKP